MYACVWLCKFVYSGESLCASALVCVRFVYGCVFVYACICLSMYVHLCMFAYVCVCLCVCHLVFVL